MIAQKERVNEVSNNKLNVMRRNPEDFHNSLFKERLNANSNFVMETDEKEQREPSKEIFECLKKCDVSKVKIQMISEILKKSDDVLLDEIKKDMAESIKAKETMSEDEPEDEVIQVVYKSTNYRKFRFLPGNRNFCTERVNEIKKTMQICGARVVPIVVNKKMQIIDGQHRYLACKELGLPIIYVIDEDADIEVARLINNTQAGWKFIDFVYSWASMNNMDYNKLYRLLTDKSLYGIAAGTRIAATSGIFHNSSNGVTKRMIREGKYTFNRFNGDEVAAKKRLIEARKLSQIYYDACNNETDVKKDLFVNAILFLLEYSKTVTVDVLRTAMENNCKQYHPLQREPFEAYVRYLCKILAMEDGRRKINPDILLEKYKKKVSKLQKKLERA